jgi:hypothetical protein
MAERAASTQCASDCDEAGGFGRGYPGLEGRRLRWSVIKIEKYELDRTADMSDTGRDGEEPLYFCG